MKITYDSICQKLGFDLESYNPKISDYEDDSKENPFSVLTLEESLFLNEYLMKYKKSTN